MRFTITVMLLTAGLFSACKDDNKQSARLAATVAPAPPPAPKTDLSQVQTDELVHMLTAYYSLKDALVATDGPKADEAASRVLSAAEGFGNEVGNAPQATEIQPQIKKIMAGCDSILAAKGNAIEQKRQYFSGVSERVFNVLKAANLKNGGVYQQYCPMAFDNKGAYWLSAEAEIKNPYYGNKMLECGEVRDSL